MFKLSRQAEFVGNASGRPQTGPDSSGQVQTGVPDYKIESNREQSGPRVSEALKYVFYKLTALIINLCVIDVIPPFKQG